MADRFGPCFAAIWSTSGYAVLDFGFGGFVGDNVNVFVPCLRKFDRALVNFDAGFFEAVADG